MRKNRKKLLLLHTQKNLVKCCWQMKEITRVLKNTQILKNDANNKKKKKNEKKFFFICPPLPIIIMTTSTTITFLRFFFCPSFYILHKKILYIKRIWNFQEKENKQSFILKENEICVEKKYYYIHTHILHIKNWCYCVQ